MSEPSVEDYRVLERKHHELQHEMCAQMQATVTAGVRTSASITALAVETNERVGRLERVSSERSDPADLGGRIDRLEHTTNERFDRVDGRIDRLEHTTNERFDKVDRQFVKIDGQFANVTEQFAKVDEQFAKIDERFVQIDKRFDEMGKDVRHRASRIEYLIGLVIRGELKAPPGPDGPADPAELVSA